MLVKRPAPIPPVIQKSGKIGKESESSGAMELLGK
jgi:hypothetical protein